MADSIGDLALHTGTTFSIGLTSMPNALPLSAVQQSEPLHADSVSPAYDPIPPSHSPTLTHELIANGDESENDGAGMTPGVDINGQGAGHHDEDDAPSDDEESDGTDMVSDRKAKPLDKNSHAITVEDSHFVLRNNRRSKRAESWAHARFDAWRALSKKPITESLEELCDRDMNELAELVGMFLSQVRKQNGKEYPPET